MSSSPIVQYVILRGDLIKGLQWPVGALVAQACHATTAAIHLFYQDPVAQEYLQDLDNMHKIVLEAPDENNLKNLEKILIDNKIDHKSWIEQPENILTCIAIKPYRKNDVQQYLKKYKLFK